MKNEFRSALRASAFLLAALASGAASVGQAAAQAPANPYFDAYFTQPALYGQLSKGIPSAGSTAATGLGATAASGNEFFPPSDYAWDCDTNPFGENDGVRTLGYDEAFSLISAAMQSPYSSLISTAGISPWGVLRNNNICRVAKMPTVDSSFVATLAAKGYEYYVSYPQVNSGNGRAILTWSRGGASNFGSARLAGAGWTNQYAPYTFCTPNPTDIRTCYDTTLPYTDATGSVISRLDGGDVSQAVRVAFHGGLDYSWYWTLPTTGYLQGGYDPGVSAAYAAWQSAVVSRGYMRGKPASAGNYFVSVIMDPWINGTETPPAPPPLPPLPPVVADAPAAGGINYGTPGSNGYGTGGKGGADGRSVVTFDYVAFCNAPGRDGKTRSAGFVGACLAGTK